MVKEVVGSANRGRTLDSQYGLYVIVAYLSSMSSVAGHVVETHYVFRVCYVLPAVVMY